MSNRFASLAVDDEPAAVVAPPKAPAPAPAPAKKPVVTKVVDTAPTDDGRPPREFSRSSYRGGRGGRGGAPSSAVEKGRRREKEHHVSGTGRDPHPPKGGAGKGNWGTGVESATIEEGLASPPPAGEAGEGTPVDAPEVAPEPEEVDNTVTYEQYLASVAAKREGVAGFEALPEAAKVAPIKGKKLAEEDLPDELDSLVVKKSEKSGPKEVKTKTTIDTSFRTPRVGGDDREFGGRGRGRGGFGRGGARPPREGGEGETGAVSPAPEGSTPTRGRGGRGGARGGPRGGGAPRGGRGGSGGAPINALDAKAFPSLG